MRLRSALGLRPTDALGGRRGGAVAVALVMAVVLSACGKTTTTLNTAKTREAIAATLLTTRGLHTTVTCPSNVPQKAGHQFTCSAQLEVGSYPIVVTETNNSGHVRYGNVRPLLLLNVAKIERSIAESILRQRRLHVTVSCPAEILQEAGLNFKCTARINGKGTPYAFVVSEVDGSGHVRYVGI